MKTIVQNILYILAAVLLAFLITRFVGMRAVVSGSSMVPTLEDRDNLIVEKLSYRFHDPKRFDIIICPGVADVDGVRRDRYIKRIIGLPGETIRIEDGKVLINGEALAGDTFCNEDYIDDPGMLIEPYTLEEDEYFVMGDNRNNSRDSRDPLLGPLKKDELIGKVWIRIWPFDQFGSVR